MLPDSYYIFGLLLLAPHRVPTIAAGLEFTALVRWTGSASSTEQVIVPG